MKKIQLFEDFVVESKNVKDVAKNILDGLDNTAQLHVDYIPKEALSTIETVLKKVKSTSGKDVVEAARKIRVELEEIGILSNTFSPADVEGIIMNHLNESIVNEAKTLTRDELMDLLENKYKIKTVRTSEEFNGKTGGIWVAGDNEEELGGNRIFYYYHNSPSKYTLGILKQVRTAIEKTGWWFEWQDPGTIIIWPNN